MKKHYAFIPLRDNDLSSFRKALLSNLWFRPFFCVLTFAVLCIIGFLKRELLFHNSPALIIFSLALVTVIYIGIPEVLNLTQVAQLKRSTLLPFIHTDGEDEDFYSEELKGGFIIQTEPVNLVDISQSKETLSALYEEYASSKTQEKEACDNESVFSYLTACLQSKDEKLLNKAVIYTEILKTQLEKGNKDILATYDKLTNCREELL